MKNQYNEHGKRHGEWGIPHFNSTITYFKATYINGRVEGLLEFFQQNGDISSTYFYLNL